MIVYLIKSERYYSMILPEKPEGKFWLKDFDKKGNERELISIEASANEWYIRSNKTAAILDADNGVLKSVKLREHCFLNVKISDSDSRVVLFTEPVTPDRSHFYKFVVRQAQTLKIGRDSSNDIVFHNEFVSSNHAVLNYDGNNWTISDKNSTNGTFVNGIRVTSRNLNPGDCLFIMGFKIVVGKQFLALNNPGNSIQLQTSGIQKYAPQRPDVNREYDKEYDREFFYRSPRLKKEIVTKTITIDPPPQSQKADTTPMALVIGPSITMGMASMSMGVFSVINVLNSGGKISQALPMVIMAFSMLLGTILWPILTRKHDNKQKQKMEMKRQQKYLNYLEEIRDEIRKEAVLQSELFNANITSVDECVKRIVDKKSNLWERMPEQNDFLRLRLGMGDAPLDIQINYEPKKFTMDDDNLQNAMLSVGTENTVLNNVPISISLVNDNKTGVIGTYHLRMDLLKSFLIQMTALHSYDELKLCLLCDDAMLEELAFVKYIPHFWNDERTQRYLAVTPEETRELSAELEKELGGRLASKDAESDRFLPYYVIIAASAQQALGCEIYKKLLGSEKDLSVSVLSFGNELKDLPKEVRTVIDLSNAKAPMMYDKDDVSGKRKTFSMERVPGDKLPELAEKMANTYLNLSGQSYVLPDMLTFLEMFNVGKIEHLNVLTRWKENDPTKTLQTPIGVSTTGELFMLDLHEKFHGPHGLVAGMTGSGKSEFIITYILSLAVNYHPDEVAFILIDYKGGGLAGAFEDDEKGIKLPHLAGTITNLDGAAITRSLISIQSELRRRQAIFNEARKISNEGTMDIYKYQQLYRQGVVDEPVPHLLIISDEFAELKAQQPEFMQQLISAARIGRSLGVHLILATQKPSGVVDDQIWSNSKFRVCLKVQEQADSREMIKRPDAAALVQTGRFYLQVGYDEFFALGQSAWCGAEYIPSENVEKKVDESVQVIDHLGRVIETAKPENKSRREEHYIKQIVGIVQYLSALAKQDNVSVRPLWLPVIPEKIYIDEIEATYRFVAGENDISPIVGIYDDPYNQCQNPLYLPLSENGNCIIYGSAGSGKEMFLASLAYSLIKNYKPENLNLYIMDFGAETLRAFEKAPHTGGVVLASEEEKMVNLLKLLTRELTYRKKEFADVGGDFNSYRTRTGKIIPHIVVLLNNIGVFREQFEDYAGLLQSLTADGVKYGIYFVATAASLMSVRYTLTQNFKTSMTMQMNDPTDYAGVLGNTNGLRPMACSGRGLVKIGEVYEFQTARCSKDGDELDFIRDFCQTLSEKMSYRAKMIPVLPKEVTSEYMSQFEYGISNIPLGIGKKELNICSVNMSDVLIYPVASQDSETCQPFVEEFSKVIQSLPISTEYWSADSQIEQRVISCFDEMVDRNNTYVDAGKEISSLDKYDEMIIVLYQVKEIFERLSDDGKDKLHTLLEHGKAIYKIHVIMIDGVNEFEQYSSRDWYKNNFTSKTGTWIGDGVTDQYFLTIGKMRSEYYEEIGSLYGYQFEKGKLTLMKIVSSEREEDF